MKLAAALLALAAASTPGNARADGPTAVDLVAGDSLKICQAGLARCPADAVLCDDPKVAFIERGDAGPELRAVAPGTTLCAVLTSGFRRVLKVTVKPRGEAQRQ